MTKTFKSPLPDSSYKFEIGKNVGAEHLFAWISGGGVDSISMALAPSDAPAIALAILEAAGHQEAQGNETTEAAHHFGMSMLHLRLGIKEQEYITAEAEAQAELEAEAVELFNANHGTNRTDWDHADRSVISSWVRVARRAREISKEATK